MIAAAPLAAAVAICLPPRPEQLTRRGAAVRADVDGDGRRDLVTIRADRGAPASCGFYLDVASRRRHLSIRVPESYKPPQDLPVAQWPFPDPYVATVVQLGRRGAQIVVSRWHSASNANVGIYAVVGGALRAVRFPPPFLGTTLSLFGTTGTGDTEVRCRRGGPLIVSGVYALDPVGHRWRLDRTDYALVRARFRVVRRSSLTFLDVQRERVARRARLSVPPFSGCTVARGRKL